MGLPGAVQTGGRGVALMGLQALSKTLNGLPRCGAGGCAWRGAEGPTTGLLEDVEWAPQVRCRWVFWPCGCMQECGGGFQPPSERCRSGRVGVCRSAGVASSLLRKGCRSGRVGVQECAGVASSLLRKGCRSGRVGVQGCGGGVLVAAYCTRCTLWRRLARAPKAVAGRAVAWTLALGASSRPGPPGVPCGGAEADLGHCQGGHFDRAAM